jgi:hypothetical protein
MRNSPFVNFMKNVIFYISAGLSIILLINILKILLTDFNRLTDYGYGYLVGKIILFILFIGITLLTRKRKITTE